MKRIGLMIAAVASMGSLFAAQKVIFHVFPVVVEFKPGMHGINPQWYVLLGRNARLDEAYPEGSFQEFGATGEYGSIPSLVVQKQQVETYIDAQTKHVYTSGDLSSLILKNATATVSDHRFVLFPKKTEAGPLHVTAFVLLNCRKPLARLNTDGKNNYKTEFKWMLISDIEKLNSAAVKELNMQGATIELIRTHWKAAQTQWLQGLCSRF